MMPKGVEHRASETSISSTAVRIPMMPKGVEHGVRKATMTKPRVRIPMMPKGVEHTNNISIVAGGSDSENSDDAERR